MQTLEYFEVESTEPVGGALYRRIASAVITDHDLLRVWRSKNFHRSKVPILSLAGGRTVPRNVVVGDICGCMRRERSFSRLHETYAPLLELYGRVWQGSGITA